jgi:hypothetical protein
MKEDKYKNTIESEIESLNSFTTLLASLNKNLDLYAMGGTAMVLAGYKSATKDIDFLTTKDIKEIRELFERLGLEEQHGGFEAICHRWNFKDIRIDIFYSNSEMIMGFPLSNEWKTKSKLIEKKKNLRIFILNWEDIISTKLARGEPRDFNDILTIMKKEKINFEKFSEDFIKKADICAGSTSNCLSNLKELGERLNARI